VSFLMLSTAAALLCAQNERGVQVQVCLKRDPQTVTTVEGVAYRPFNRTHHRFVPGNVVRIDNQGNIWTCNSAGQNCK
jgi:hypothetical protein